MKKVKIILDCDTKNEIDDQFTIVYALKDPKIKLEGVVSVQNTRSSGKNSVDIYHKEAKKLLKLSNSKVPAFKGSRQPLKSKNSPESSEGVKFIIDTVMRSREKIFVVGTGPCTDIVNACLIEPKIMKKCTFIWLGGFRNNKIFKELKKQGLHKECNYYGDQKATELLFQLDIDLVLLPAWGVTNSLILSCPTFVEELEERNLPITMYLAKLIKDYRHQSKKIYIWTFWDLAAPAVAKNFGICKKKKIPAPRAVKGGFYFPAKNKHTITMIDSIHTLDILKQAKEYILR